MASLFPFLSISVHLYEPTHELLIIMYVKRALSFCLLSLFFQSILFAASMRESPSAPWDLMQTLYRKKQFLLRNPRIQQPLKFVSL